MITFINWFAAIYAAYIAVLIVRAPSSRETVARVIAHTVAALCLIYLALFAVLT